jgi:hypothetical protein
MLFVFNMSLGSKPPLVASALTQKSPFLERCRTDCGHRNLDISLVPLPKTRGGPSRARAYRSATLAQPLAVRGGPCACARLKICISAMQGLGHRCLGLAGVAFASPPPTSNTGVAARVTNGPRRTKTCCRNLPGKNGFFGNSVDAVLI